MILDENGRYLLSLTLPLEMQAELAEQGIRPQERYYSLLNALGLVLREGITRVKQTSDYDNSLDSDRIVLGTRLEEICRFAQRYCKQRIRDYDLRDQTLQFLSQIASLRKQETTSHPYSFNATLH